MRKDKQYVRQGIIQGILKSGVTFKKDGGRVNMILLDMDSYAEKNNLNFSKVLQDALFSMAQAKQRENTQETC